MLKEYELQNQILKGQYSDLSIKLTNLTKICEELDKKDRIYGSDKFSTTGSFKKMFSSRGLKSTGLSDTLNNISNATHTQKSFKK
jgi:hypothetical protein